MALVLGLALVAQAQTRGKGFFSPYYKRHVLESVFTGESVVELTNEVVVQNLVMTTYAEGSQDKPQFILQTPECRLSIRSSTWPIPPTKLESIKLERPISCSKAWASSAP